MSHTTSIKSIKISSVTALRAAVQEMADSGLPISLVENETPRAFYANQSGLGKADFVIRLGGSSRYDVGLYKQADGSYEARTDFWGGDVEKVLGDKPTKPENAQQAKLGRLFKTYGIHAAMEQVRRSGKTCRRAMGSDGVEKLIVTGF